MIDISYFVKCALIGSRSYIVSCISEQKNHASYYQQCFKKQYALSESMTYRVFMWSMLDGIWLKCGYIDGLKVSLTRPSSIAAID